MMFPGESIPSGKKKEEKGKGRKRRPLEREETSIRIECDSCTQRKNKGKVLPKSTHRLFPVVESIQTREK